MRFPLLVCAAVLLLVNAACSSSSKGNTATSSAQLSAAPPATTQAQAGAASAGAATASAQRPTAAATQGQAPSSALIVGAAAPKPFAGLDGSISAVAFSPDGKILAAGGQDAFVQLWDVATGLPLKMLKSPNARDANRAFNLRTLAFSPDGKRIAKDGPPLVVWDVATGQPLFEKFVFNSAGAGGGASSLAFSPNGKVLAVGDSLSLQLLDPGTGALLKLLVESKQTQSSPETIATRSLAFSPDGKTLASAGPANAVTLWDVATGQKGATLTGLASRIDSVSFSPDGKHVAGGGVNDITVWELPAGTSPKTLVHQSTDHTGVSSVAFSSNGKFLAGTSVLGLDLWDATTWKAVPITTALNQAIHDAFAFSADGQFLAGIGTGDDHVVKVWPLASGPAPAATAAAAQPQATRATRTDAGAPKPSTAPAGKLDVCKLVTQAEAEAILGAPVTKTESRELACRYEAADGSEVGIDSYGTGAGKFFFTAFHTGDVKDIAGVGDKAFVAGGLALYILKGETLFEITVTPADKGFENGVPSVKLLALARAAAGRV
jgi:WD40 repeat protein